MISLVVSLVATMACLGAAVWSGIVRRRHLHYALVALTFVLLGLAIWRAEVYGSTLRFLGVALLVHRVHMVFVAITFLLVPAAIWSGVQLARAPQASVASARARHRKFAVAFVVLIVITAALGTAMTLLAEPA